jgi:methyltransferase (TIGR00027 family)
MSSRQPSRTAIVAAGYRAAHQICEGGSIFKDPHAIAILGSDGDAIITALSADDPHGPMRVFMAARSRFAEDHVGTAVARGVRQVVILGAGLDTFSIRNPYAQMGLQVFEVDHPASQEWKRERLAEVGLTPLASTTFVGVDFETQSLGSSLIDAGVNLQAPVFFIWLGVVPYLTRDAIFKTLNSIATLPGSEVIFDYSEPLEHFASERRVALEALAARASAIGEPWLSYFDPTELSELLHASGFDAVEDLGISGIASRYFGMESSDSDVGPEGHILYARVPG